MIPRFSSPLLILLVGFILCKVNGTDEILSARLHVHLKDLLHSDSCSPSTKGVGSSTNRTRLRVVHRHGPCSPFAGHQKQLSLAKILDMDKARVDDIHRHISHSEPLPASAAIPIATLSGAYLDEGNYVVTVTVIVAGNNVVTAAGNHASTAAGNHAATAATSIPTRSGVYLDSGNYVVTVGFGTPKKDQTVVFDTGSSVSWIQCQPCVVSCHEQEAPLFDPSLSSTYANISCASSFCNELGDPGCSDSNCIYTVRYGDGSFTVGFYAQDTLMLSPSDSILGFRFGCGERNTGLFGRTDGLLGLGRDKASIVSQTYNKYGGVFSYCLPLTSSSVGYLAFGSYPAGNLQLTPMLSNVNFPTFYYLELTGISVGGQLIAVPPSIFTNGGTIIDSSTVITRLPTTAYSALRSAFQQGMTAYKSVPAGDGLLDTCYNFSGSGGQVNIPSVALHLGGEVTIDLEGTGILIGVSSTQACLAFAGNGNDSRMSILGSTQQRGFNVLYDLNRRVIGFGPGDCS